MYYEKFVLQAYRPIFDNPMDPFSPTKFDLFEKEITNFSYIDDSYTFMMPDIPNDLYHLYGYSS